MNILGIAHSHEAHACIVSDGKLINCIAEERLSRLKADSSFPKRAVDWVLSDAKMSAADLDLVCVAGQSGRLFKTVLKQNACFSVDDFIRQQHDYWKPKLIEGRPLTQADEFNMFKHIRGPDLEEDLFYPIIKRQLASDQSEWSTIGNEMRKQVIADYLGVSTSKVIFLRHEDCHKAYGLFSSNGLRDNTIVLTLEGGGDDSAATVSTVRDEIITEHWSSNDVMVGRLYQQVTLMLGLKPGQHEYKVMGLAPYSNEYVGKASLDLFRSINFVDGIEIKNSRKFRDLYFDVKRALEGERFDGIAWGLQEYLEEILVKWVKNCIRHFGMKNVILSGGVAQNIKACKKIREIPELEKFWVGPISGDGSLAIGAAWLGQKQHFPSQNIHGLSNVYLGSHYGEKSIDKALEKYRKKSLGSFINKPTAEFIAQKLFEGAIVARFSGRMEFGQRALGNRSILANPCDRRTLDHINSKVKFRDFWMPFTPSMTENQANKIVKDSKNYYSPFMSMAFDLKPEYKNLLPAARHPSDRSIRPQMLRREDNYGYYEILEEFGKISGIEALLNTSFNLHGEPIVESPENAIESFSKSRIDILLFDHVAIVR